MNPPWGERCEKLWSFLTGMCFLRTGCVSKSHCWELLIKHNWCDGGKGDEEPSSPGGLWWRKFTPGDTLEVEGNPEWTGCGGTNKHVGATSCLPCGGRLPLGARICTNRTKGHFGVFLTSEGPGTCHLPALLKHKERVTVPKRCDF